MPVAVGVLRVLNVDLKLLKAVTSFSMLVDTVLVSCVILSMAVDGVVAARLSVTPLIASVMLLLARDMPTPSTTKLALEACV